MKKIDYKTLKAILKEKNIKVTFPSENDLKYRISFDVNTLDNFIKKLPGIVGYEVKGSSKGKVCALDFIKSKIPFVASLNDGTCSEFIANVYDVFLTKENGEDIILSVDGKIADKNIFINEKNTTEISSGQLLISFGDTSETMIINSENLAKYLSEGIEGFAMF